MNKKASAKKIMIETRLWAFAAWTVPFVALAGIFFVYFIGWNTLAEQLLTIGGILFFAISVFWWWWAISKISQLSKMILDTTHRFSEIKQNLQEIKKDNVDNR